MSFYNLYARAHRCKSTPRGDLDGIGAPTAKGEACANCFSCDSRIGEVGIAGDGSVRIVRTADGLRVEWSCPGCGGSVVEATSVFTVEADAAGALADPLCAYCRRRAARATGSTD